MELSERVLRLCKTYKRCLECGRIMVRGGRGRGAQRCPLCMHLSSRELKIREDFLRWYEIKGKALESVLPRPMPKDAEVSRMLREIRKAKKHE